MDKYRPSNGTEGMIFTEKYCDNCIHEHNSPENRKSCEILTKTMVYGLEDPEYPKEWCYVNDKPTCTSWVKWDWGNDGNPDNPDNPKAPVPYDPNQLMLFSSVDELINEKIESYGN